MYFGTTLADGHSICFSDDGSANLQLAKASTIGGISFPAGSYVEEDATGKPASAVLSSDIQIGSMKIKSSNLQQVDLYLNAAAQVRRAVLAAPANVNGISVKDEITIQDSGVLASGILSGDQMIDGVPFMGDQYIQLNDKGHPIYFTAAAPYTIGMTQLQRGQPFLGTYQKQGVLPIFDGSKGELANAMQQLQGELISKATDAVRTISSKFPFGNIAGIQDHDFVWSGSGNTLNISQQLHVEKLFTNAPFADCDGDLKLDATVTWLVVPEFMKQSLVAWPSTLTISYKHGMCPGTAAIEDITGALYILVPHIREMLDSKTSGLVNGLAQKGVIQKEIQDVSLAKYEQLLQLLQTDTTIVKYSIRIDSLVIESGSLNLHYSYSVMSQ